MLMTWPAAHLVVPGSQVQVELEELVHKSRQQEAQAELQPKEEAAMAPRVVAVAWN